MPIIPRFQQESDPNQPPRIDFGDRLMQGMVAGAQAQRFAAEADYRKQMAAIQQEQLGITREQVAAEADYRKQMADMQKEEFGAAREQRAMAQQERADLAAIEGFMLTPGVAAPPSLTPQAGQAMQRGMAQGLQQGAAAGPMGAAMAGARGAMSGAAGVDQVVQDPALEGARAFADQLKTDSAKTFFYQRFASARKNEMVKAEIGNTQREYGRLVSGLIRNPKIQGKFDGQIEGLKSVIDMLDDEGQTPESRAQILLSVQKEIGAIRKQANDETTRLNKYASTMSMYESQLGKLDPNKAEYSALLSQFSAFENNPDATPEEIEENNVAIRNISAGRYAWSDKVRDWDTPDRIASREAELYLNNQKVAMADIGKQEAQGRLELTMLSKEEMKVGIEGKIQEIANNIYNLQFYTDDTGAQALRIDPQSFRSLEAIVADLRKSISTDTQVSASRGTMESARAEGGDIAASIAGDIVGGGEQRPTVVGGEQKPTIGGGEQKPPVESIVNPDDYSLESLRSSGKMSLGSIESQKADLLSRRRALNEGGIIPSRNREKASKIESALKQIGAAEDRIKKAYEAFNLPLLQRVNLGPFTVFNGPYGLEKARRGKTNSTDDFKILYEYLSNDSRFSAELARLRSLSEDDFTYEYDQVPRNMK